MIRNKNVFLEIARRTIRKKLRNGTLTSKGIKQLQDAGMFPTLDQDLDNQIKGAQLHGKAVARKNGEILRYKRGEEFVPGKGTTDATINTSAGKVIAHSNPLGRLVFKRFLGKNFKHGISNPIENTITLKKPDERGSYVFFSTPGYAKLLKSNPELAKKMMDAEVVQHETSEYIQGRKIHNRLKKLGYSDDEIARKTAAMMQKQREHGSSHNPGVLERDKKYYDMMTAMHGHEGFAPTINRGDDEIAINKYDNRKINPEVRRDNIIDKLHRVPVLGQILPF